MIYFLQTEAGPIKVGYTRDEETLPRRLRNLQVGSYEELELLGTNAGSMAQERWLHWLLRSEWLRGEWHVGSPALEAAARQPTCAGAADLLGDLTEEHTPIREVREVRGRRCPACSELISGEAAVVGAAVVHFHCAEEEEAPEPPRPPRKPKPKPRQKPAKPAPHRRTSIGLSIDRSIAKRLEGNEHG